MKISRKLEINITRSDVRQQVGRCKTETSRRTIRDLPVSVAIGFLPDPRVGTRQRACGKAGVQTGATQANTGAMEGAEPRLFHCSPHAGAAHPGPNPRSTAVTKTLIATSLGFGAKTSSGCKGADFLGVMGRLLRAVKQDQFHGYVANSTAVAGTLRSSLGQDPMRHDAL